MVFKMLEVCKVSPPPGSPDDIHFPLTFFDLPRLIFPPAELLFFYEAPPRPENFFSSIFPKLKHSLSLTLKHFLPVAGNLVWPPSAPNPFIQYKNGDGILLTLAQSKADFYHLSGKNLRESKMLRPLVAHIVGSDSQVPVIALKITIFPNKGICIAVTVHHSLFDAKSVAMFMKAWASFTNVGEDSFLEPELFQVSDREAIIKQYLQLENSCIEILKRNGVHQKISVVPGSEPLPNIVRGTFELSGSDVRRLKELVHARLLNDKHRELNQIPYASTFTVAYAYVVLCLVKSKGLISKRVQITFAFDCRHRLKPPVSTNYFGNCIGPCTIYINTDDLLGGEGISVIVNSISERLKGLDEGALKGAEEWVSNIFEKVTNTETMRIYVSGSGRNEFQGTDFGWGRPRKVDITSIDGTGGVTFTQGGDVGGGGIEIDLSLNKLEMEKFALVFRQGLSQIRHMLAAL